MKNQVAMEYIVTYGWALLAVVVLIGGLSYFGVFRATETLPDNCFFTKEIECYDYRIVDNTGVNGKHTIELYLKNLDKNDLYVSRVQCKIDDVSWEYTEGGTPALNEVFTEPEDMTGSLGLLRTNRRAYIKCEHDPIPSVAEGSKIKAEIILDVYTDSSFVHQISGDVFTKVQ